MIIPHLRCHDCKCGATFCTCHGRRQCVLWIILAMTVSSLVATILVPASYLFDDCELPPSTILGMETMLKKFTHAMMAFDLHDWWIDSGTLLGAHRQHGIIPWDKDIDIAMTESEYQRLVSFRSALARDYGLYLWGTQICFTRVAYMLRAGQGEALKVKLDIFVLTVVDSASGVPISLTPVGRASTDGRHNASGQVPASTMMQFRPSVDCALPDNDAASPSSSSNCVFAEGTVSTASWSFRRSDLLRTADRGYVDRMQLWVMQLLQLGTIDQRFDDVYPLSRAHIWSIVPGNRNMTLPAPRRTEPYLERAYGEAWRKPRQWKVRCYVGG